MTRGAALRLVGVLVRDTDPNENDVSTRGRSLGSELGEGGSIELHALYMPTPMDRWTELVADD